MIARFLGIGIFFGCSAVLYAQSDADKVTVVGVLGQVQTKAPLQAAWRAVKHNMPLRTGYDIRTFVESSADVRFGNGTTLHIGENSVVTLARLSQNAQTGVSSTAIKVGTGTILANVQKMTSRQSSFQFETPTAVAAIRGTRLGITVSDKGTAVDVYEGVVTVRSKGSLKEISVTDRMRALVKAGSNDVRLVTFEEAKKDTSQVKIPLPSGSDSGTVNQTAIPQTVHIDSLPVVSDTTTSPVPVPDTVSHFPAPDVKTPDTDSDSAFMDTLGSGLQKSTVPRVTLQVKSPVSGAVVDTTAIRVSGTTTPQAVLTIDNAVVAVDAMGNFSSTVHIPDEPGAYTIDIESEFAGKSVSVQRVVSYSPRALPLFLNVNTPVDKAIITSGSVRVAGTTSSGSVVRVNTRTVVVSGNGQFSCDILPSEKEIGDFVIEVVASNSNGEEISKAITVFVAAKSRLTNTSVPAQSC